MLHRILESTGFVLFLIGAMAVDHNPWYVPVGLMLIGASVFVWGLWEQGIIQRNLSERRRRQWSHRK